MLQSVASLPPDPQAALSIRGLGKTYGASFTALKRVDIDIQKGEIFALLGPNGAGKTTMINLICGIVKFDKGVVLADGHDVVRDYRAARAKIGLVPQELTMEQFETVWDTVRFTRGLYGKPANDAYVEQLLKDLALWDKKNNRIRTLSGGMKRRVLIAKALSHEPTIVFLDEPTAGVDVSLRREMWEMVGRLRERGVTIILTTHYIEEAEEMADRIGVINKGEIILVEDKKTLMAKLGKKQLILQLQAPLTVVPTGLAPYNLELGNDGANLIYTFDAEHETGIADLLRALSQHGIDFKDIQSRQSTLEDIFVGLVHGAAA